MCKCQDQDDCKHPWHFNFKWKRQNIRLSLDKHLRHHLSTRKEAEEVAESLRGTIRQGRNPFIRSAHVRDKEFIRDCPVVQSNKGRCNKYEQQVFDQLTRAGYLVLKNGWPDFLALRAGEKPRLIEVKRPWEKFEPSQIKMFQALREIGFEVEVAVVKDTGVVL